MARYVAGRRDPTEKVRHHAAGSQRPGWQINLEAQVKGKTGCPSHGCSSSGHGAPRGQGPADDVDKKAVKVENKQITCALTSSPNSRRRLEGFFYGSIVIPEQGEWEFQLPSPAFPAIASPDRARPQGDPELDNVAAPTLAT